MRYPASFFEQLDTESSHRLAALLHEYEGVLPGFPLTSVL